MRESTYVKESRNLRPRIKESIKTSLENWSSGQKVKSDHQGSARTGYSNKQVMDRDGEVFKPITRRRIDTQMTSDLSQLEAEPEVFKISRIKALGRLFVWLYMIFLFVSGNLADKVLRQDSEARRAVRLRRTFERVGGTFVKFGQQMAMRIDLLPWVYTVELAKMLDNIPPFPLEQAIDVIERTTGKKWQDIFAVFDPEPIGSASIACVYQAILKNGDKVAVKVRRPKIGELFMADFKVFDWLLDLAEFLTLVRPGYTENLRSEFKTLLTEELDFIQEARFQDMFRRNARKTGEKIFTAPKLYPEYCNREVIIQAYTSGIWLWEVMAGVEQGNAKALARMRELNIEPKKVAQNLLWVNYWGMQENLFFHADPHPANVIVRKNSKLTFIDFGSCGSFNREQRAGLELTAIASGRSDAEGMARGTMKLFEPLPPLDVKELFQEAEAEYTRVLTVFKSKQEQTEWWERTSILQWMSFLKFSRENNITVAIHTLRMIRATLLYDTVAVRICKEVDRFEEYIKFRKFREKKAKIRIAKRIKKQARKGLDSSVYLWIEDIAKTGQKLMYRTQSMLDSPIFNFSSMIGKWFFTTSMVIKMTGQIFAVTILGVVIAAVVQLLRGRDVLPVDLLVKLLTNRFYLVAIALVLITNIRHILFRIKDQEV